MPTEDQKFELLTLGWIWYPPCEGMPWGYVVNFKRNEVKPYDARTIADLTPLPSVYRGQVW